MRFSILSSASYVAGLITLQYTLHCITFHCDLLQALHYKDADTTFSVLWSWLIGCNIHVVVCRARLCDLMLKFLHVSNTKITMGCSACNCLPAVLKMILSGHMAMVWGICCLSHAQQWVAVVRFLQIICTDSFIIPKQPLMCRKLFSMMIQKRSLAAECFFTTSSKRNNFVNH